MRIFIIAFIISLVTSATAFAGVPQPIVTPVPTLGEWGIIALFVALGIVGFIALRKRLAAQSGK